MFQDILYYWKSVLSVVLALIIGIGLGVGGSLYLAPAPETVVYGSKSAEIGGSVMREITKDDVVLNFPLHPGAYSPLMKPVDMPNDEAWVFAYTSVDFETMKFYYDSALNGSPWKINSSEVREDSVTYNVTNEGYSGEITLSKASAPGINSVIQGSLKKS